MTFRRRRRSVQPRPPRTGTTLCPYMALGSVDELRLHFVPISLGAGERVVDGVTNLTFDVARVRETDHVVHVTLHLVG